MHTPDPQYAFFMAQAERKQEAYRERRAEWASATGRPYPEDAADPRPPPGEWDPEPPAPLIIAIDQDQ